MPANSLAMPEQIYLEVEENPNSEYMPLMLFEAHASPVRVERIRLDEPGRTGIFEVVGWSSRGEGTPVPAAYVPVSDSGQALVHLVYGADWGIRLRPMGCCHDWSLEASDQFGEPYVMLISEGDVIL